MAAVSGEPCFRSLTCCLAFLVWALDAPSLEAQSRSLRLGRLTLARRGEIEFTGAAGCR